MRIFPSYIFLMLFFFFFKGHAQNNKQRKNDFFVETNYLNKIGNSFHFDFKEKRKQILRFAEKQNLPLKIVYPNGEISFLYDFDETGFPSYRKTFDIHAAITVGTSELYPDASLGLSLEGQGMTAGIWDNGAVRGTHELLENKVFQIDTPDEFTDHATHVAGIMVGKEVMGKGAQGRGMAYKANLKAYDWFDDLSEMAFAAAEGLLVSNHSYGKDLEQFSQEVDIHPFFGSYNAVSSAIDDIAFHAPFYTIVAAAGNDRIKDLNPEANGYNILGSERTTAKNAIVVAAVHEVLNYTGPESVVMTDFSSWGPANDNRVKPDISAQGRQVFSATAFYPPFSENGADSDTTYIAKSGTSMAAPGVAGSILLLQELSADLYEGSFLKSSTVKALIIHTARQADSEPGPDPKYGWGLLHTKAAAELMLEDFENQKQGSEFFQELSLNENQSVFTNSIIADGSAPLKATMAWTDPAADSQVSLGGPDFSEIIVDDSPVLINDLDLRITDSQGNIYYPWRLNPLFEGPALNDADNSVDNVEQVLIENPIEGEIYTITVSHKGILENNLQDFALVVSGIKKELSVEYEGKVKTVIYPNPVRNKLFVETAEDYNSVEIEIFNLLGKKVLHKILKSAPRPLEIEVDQLKSGIYFLRITAQGKSEKHKLIIH